MTYQRQLLFNISLTVCVLLVATRLLSTEAKAQGGSVLVSDATIHRAGLLVEWSSQAPVGASNQLVDWELLIDENQATTTVEVRAGNRREVISQHDRNPLGEPLGVAGAQKLGQARKEHMLAEFAARGKKDIEVTVETFQQPKATMFLMSDSGDVTAFDANTGKTHWLNRVGSSSSPGIGLGANAKYVAVVKGSVLYCLEASTGKELWSKKCRYSVGSSPAVSDEHIAVPLTDGRLELFSLENDGLGSHALIALGEGTAQPLVTAASVSWPTTRGELNVMMRNNNGRSISYRLRSDDAIVSEATTDGKNLYVGSLDGFLYAINEVRGSVRWEISLGVGISQSPVSLGEFVYAISDDDKLFKVVADTGEPAPGWENPMEKISRYLGASEKNLYLLDSRGTLAVVNRDSKSIVSSTPVGQIDLVLNNYKSDRLYIASKSGAVQCLREVTSERPFFHGDEIAGKIMEGSGSKQGSDSKQGSGSANDNPFAADAGSDNPFGGGGGDNPFAGSDTKDGSGSKDDGSGAKDPFGSPADDGSGTKDKGSGSKDPFGSPAEEGSGSKDDGSGTKDEGSGSKDPFDGPAEEEEDPFG